jgi:hypothetical protein
LLLLALLAVSTAVLADPTQYTDISGNAANVTGIVAIANGGSGRSTLPHSAVGSQPTCAVGIRGQIWNVDGGAGVADIFQVCEKDSSDAYVWVTK